MFRLLGHEPVAHPVRMRVSRGRGSGPSSLPRSGDGGAREAKEKYRVVVDVPDVQATIHRRDEERAGECVVVAGVRSCRGRQERLTAAVNLATSLSSQGKYDEAEKMQREVLAVDQRVLGAEHPDTLSTAGKLALCNLFKCVRVCIELVPALVLVCVCVFACVHMMGSHEL